MAEWQDIATAPKAFSPQIDLWLTIPPSPRSMGMGDAFRVIDCWWDDKLGWVHSHNGETAALYQPYVTHWRPVPDPPVARPDRA